MGAEIWVSRTAPVPLSSRTALVPLKYSSVLKYGCPVPLPSRTAPPYRRTAPKYGCLVPLPVPLLPYRCSEIWVSRTAPKYGCPVPLSGLPYRCPYRCPVPLLGVPYRCCTAAYPVPLRTAAAYRCTPYRSRTAPPYRSARTAPVPLRYRSVPYRSRTALVSRTALQTPLAGRSRRRQLPVQSPVWHQPLDPQDVLAEARR